MEKEKQPQTGDILKDSGKLNQDCLHQERRTHRERERETPSSSSTTDNSCKHRSLVRWSPTEH